MTNRQALDRAVLRFLNVDISLKGYWEPLPERAVECADEIANDTIARLFDAYLHCTGVDKDDAPYPWDEEHLAEAIRKGKTINEVLEAI